MCSPTIFYRLAEDNAGSDDLTLLPEFGATGAPPLLNFTEIESRLAGNPDVLGATPRWATLGRIGNRDDRDRNTTAVILVVDSVRETELNIGAAWDRRPLGLEEAYVVSSSSSVLFANTALHAKSITFASFAVKNSAC